MKIKKDKTYVVLEDFSDYDIKSEKVVFVKGKKYTAHQDDCIRGENGVSYNFAGYSKVNRYFKEFTEII